MYGPTDFGYDSEEGSEEDEEDHHEEEDEDSSVTYGIDWNKDIILEEDEETEDDQGIQFDVKPKRNEQHPIQRRNRRYGQGNGFNNNQYYQVSTAAQRRGIRNLNSAKLRYENLIHILV